MLKVVNLSLVSERKKSFSEIEVANLGDVRNTKIRKRLNDTDNIGVFHFCNKVFITEHISTGLENTEI